MESGIKTPLERLMQKINKEIPTIKFLGDILINEQEYKLLIGHLSFQYKSMLLNSGFLKLDPLSAVALVQIGIRNYDGSYWPYVASELGVCYLPGNQQTEIGNAFYKALQLYGMPRLRQNERVNNILMHGFVSNNYSDSFFDFLFAFYKIDLERDIIRLDDEIMQELLSVMTRNDNTGRTY